MGLDWGSVPDWIVAATALIGVLVANRQLVLIRRANMDSAKAAQASVKAYEHSVKAHADQVEIERANLLLRLDEQYESQEMLESRRAWGALINRIEAEVTHGDRPRERLIDVEKAIAREMSAFLNRLWTSSQVVASPTEDAGDPASSPVNVALNQYGLYVRLLNWFETVGHLCQRNLVPDDDVLALYYQVVIKTVGLVDAHIELRCEDGAIRSVAQWENARWLLERAIVYKAQRETPSKIEPSRSDLNWTSR